MITKQLTIALSLVLLISLFAACGQKPEPSQNTAQPQLTTPAQVGTAPTQPQLTAQEAEAIALQHANLTANSISRIRTELDRDDGILVYEVEFYHQGLEYEYKIHANSGSILSFSVDKD